jgi:hypothetical protein
LVKIEDNYLKMIDEVLVRMELIMIVFGGGDPYIYNEVSNVSFKSLCLII